MKVALKTLRRVGYHKIVGLYCDEDIVSSIEKHHMEYLAFDKKAYSILSDKEFPMYDGLRGIIKYLGLTGDSAKDKRAFTNFYNRVWKEFGEALDLDESTICALRSYGLNPNVALQPSILSFYNTVILWSILLYSEVEVPVGIEYILTYLTIRSIELFESVLYGVILQGE